MFSTCDEKCDECFAALKFVDPGVESGKPVRVVVRFSGSPCCEKNMQKFFEQLSEVYKLQRKMRIIYDATQVGIVNPSLLSLQVKDMRARDGETRRLVERCGVVVSSSLVQGIVASIFKLKPPACPLEIFDTFEAAKMYCSKP